MARDPLAFHSVSTATILTRPWTPPSQNLISILAGSTDSNITITSFTEAERVTLQGYAGGSAIEAGRALATAQVGVSTVLTLSDNTCITFIGVTHLTSSSFV